MFQSKDHWVYYRGELIGNFIPDLIVEDAVIVDPKVVSCFSETHVTQMVGYLNITGLDSGPAHKFQEGAPGLETCVASPSARRRRHC